MFDACMWVWNPLEHLQRMHLARHPISFSLGTLSTVSNASARRKNKCLESVLLSVLLKNACARLCHSHASVWDDMHICVSYLSREPHSAAELMMSCGTCASPPWQAHSEDSSLFTRAPAMTFYWMTCSSICSVRTASLLFQRDNLQNKQLRPTTGLLMNA